MPHINQIKKSNFLKKEDCGQGILVTIKSCSEENVAAEGAPIEMKWCLHFNEQDKPMVLNSTNAQIIAAVTGNPDTDFWTGHKIVLYHDPNVSYGGKLIGGIRARAPRNQPVNQARPQPVAQPAYVPPTPSPLMQGGEEIPF